MERRHIMVWALLLGAAVFPGSSNGTRSHDAPRPTPTPSRPTRGHACTHTIVVRETVGASACWIDERVTHAPGMLTWACGDGPATARFGNTVFTGNVVDRTVSLRLQTHFHYSDGCEWETLQVIHGPIQGPTMDYTYTESPVAGQRGCANACRATATVSVR